LKSEIANLITASLGMKKRSNK